MTLLTIVIFGIMALIVGAWIVARLEYEAREREKRFEKIFTRAQVLLCFEPDEPLMRELLILVKQLEHWDNLEKVNMIKAKFFADYKNLSDEILSENEFAPENVFKN